MRTTPDELLRKLDELVADIDDFDGLGDRDKREITKQLGGVRSQLTVSLDINMERARGSWRARPVG